MSVKTSIAAIAAFIAVAAAPEFASAQAEYNVVQIAQRPIAQHRALRNVPADAYGSAYGYVGSVQTIRPSQLTGGQGHDFQLEGRF
jgi:hypothetical protein